VFVTTGLFRRQMGECGWQWGVVHDPLSDEFAQDFDVGQVRGELSFVFRANELGVWFASGISDDEPDIVLPGGIASFEALDMYAFFYRRQLINGGEGRLWVGATGDNDPLFGGDIRVPIACDWDLAGSFNYIAGDSDVATRDFPEAWNVGISLVWYVCPQGALRAGCSPYRPLLNVADNGTLVVNTVR
jgi:hypothetical protein